MFDERNRDNQAAAQPPSFDTTRYGDGYFPYDTTPKTTEPKVTEPLRPAAQPPAAQPTQRLPQVPGQSQTGDRYGSGYAPRGGLRTPPGMLAEQRRDLVPSTRPAVPATRPAVQPTSLATPANRPAAPPVTPYSEFSPPPSARAKRPPGTAHSSPFDMPRPRPKQRFGAVRVICLLLACILMGGGSAYFVSNMLIADFEETLEGTLADFDATHAMSVPTPPLATPDPTPTPPPTTPIRTGNALTAEEVYELGRRQVVGITTEITNTNVFGQATTGRVSGSGFIVSEDGYILTNYHVIEGATRILVMLHDYTMHEATLVGGEGITSDMAVLKIDATDLHLSVAALGNFSEMRVGSQVFPIGNPLGELTFTITQGIVSALSRDVAVGQGQVINMFQIDAAVNSGNSGGPVYNEFGEVVGIVTAKAALDGVEGIGFAIPIDDAMGYANQLIERGYVPRPYLGIFPVTVTESYAELFGSVVGVYVNTVFPDSGAAAAGMLEGDIITAIDGREIRSVEDLQAVLSGHAPGDTIVVIVWREGATLNLSVTLGDRPPDAG